METVCMERVREHAKRVGSHWFDTDTLRFFRGRVASYGYETADGTRVYFVSSEQFCPSRGAPARRRYSVRVADMTGADRGCVDTLGVFQAFASRNGALRAAIRACMEYDAASKV